MRRLIPFGLVCVMSVGLIACGESADHRLQRAQIAMANDKAETALELSRQVLTERPGDPEALMVQAQAHIRLIQFTQARTALDQILAKDAANAKARRLLVSWSFNHTEQLMRQSDFPTSADKQKLFEEALTTGQTQARWLRDNDKAAAEADYLLARMAIVDADRYRINLANHRKSLQAVELAGHTNEESAAYIAQTEKTIEDRTREALLLLKTAMETDPRQFVAAELYADLLTRRQDWATFWVLAQKVSGQKDIPAGLASRLVLTLLIMPDAVEPLPVRKQMCRTLQDAVLPQRRNNTIWKVSEARLLIRNDEPVKAQPLLEEVVKSEPRNHTARFLLAQTYHAQKDYARAKDDLQKLATEVNSPEVFTLYGLTLLELGDIGNAKEALRKATELNPDDPTPRAALVRALAKEGDLSGGRDDVEALYARNPSDPKAIRFKLQFEQVRNRRDAIAELLNKVANLRPLLDEHLMILIDGYNYLGKYEQMRQYAQELVRKKPEMIDAHLRLAQAMLMLNQDEQVRQMLVDLHKKFPESSSTNQMLGELYLARQSYDKAVELLQKVVDLEPRNDAARMALVRALAALSLTDEALTHVNHLLDKNPRDASAHALAARIYQYTGRMDKANEHLSKIDIASVDERTSPALLAQLKLRANQFDDAIDICNRALAMGNTDPTLRQILADVYLRKNDNGQAETHLLALARMQPRNPLAYALLTRFYIQSKQVDKGLMELTNLQTSVEPLTESLSRMGVATLLASVGRYDDAIGRLSPILEPLIRRRDATALGIADTLARLYMLKRDLTAATAVYQMLITADLMPAQAMLRQIDLTAGSDKPDLIVGKLDALAGRLTPEDHRVRLEVIQRFAALNRYDKALALTQQWLTIQPNQVQVMRVKAQLQERSGDAAGAVATLRQAMQTAPDDTSLLLLLAGIYLRSFDYPNAQATLESMTKLDAGARINGLAELGLTYVSLGLNEEARKTFDRLERESKVSDPRVMLAMGRAFAALQMNEQARNRLALVPEYSQPYPAAQVLLARLEQSAGLSEQARARLEKLMGDPNTAAMASAELLTLSLRSRQAEELIRWSEKKLAEESLPENLRRAWLNIRILLADNSRDYAQMLRGLDQMARNYPDSLQLSAARIVVLLRANKPEQAKLIYLNNEKIKTSPWGPLLAVALAEPPTVPDKYPAFQSFVVALSISDTGKAKEALDRLEPLRTVFKKDLQALLDRSDAASQEMAFVNRQLALSLVALECNLPRLASDLAQGAITRMPMLTPAYAVVSQTAMDMEEQIDPVLAQIKTAAPQASLTLLLSAQQKVTAKDYAGAAELYQKLLEGEPANIHIRRQYSQALQMAGKTSQAIEVLEQLYAKPTVYHTEVANDLAYLLAESQPTRLEEAHRIAQQAYDLTRKDGRASPPLLDTLGWIEHRRGNNVKALQLLSGAIGPLHEMPEVHYHIGVVYREVGNLEWARKHLQDAAESKLDRPEVKLAKKALETLGK